MVKKAAALIVLFICLTSLAYADNVYYSTNTKDNVKNGNSGVYSYIDEGRYTDNYIIIDFDEAVVYFFSNRNGNNGCDRVKIVSGDLNSVLIVTYHDGKDTWSYGMHFKWAKSPSHLVLQDEDGFEFDYYPVDLVDAVKLLNEKTIRDY